MRDTRYMAKLAKIQEHQKFVADVVREQTLKRDIEDRKSVQAKTQKMQVYEEVFFWLLK